MKITTRFIVILFLIVGMLMAVNPASAGATRTPVSGIMEFQGEDFPSNWREWSNEKGIYHSRHHTEYYKFVMDDERLSGWAVADVNYNWVTAPDWSTIKFAHDSGKATITQDEAGTIVTWECSGQGTYDDTWFASADFVCQGRGDNKGLLAIFTLSGYGNPYDVNGEILEPGGK